MILPTEVKIADEMILGRLRFYSMNTQTIDKIHLKLVERYSRGGNDDKLVDEYKLGEINMNKKFEVIAGEPVEIPFELPFSLMKSEMDDIEDSNLLLGGLVKVGKWFSNVKSEFRVEVEANAIGVALNPFDKKIIQVK